MFKPGDRLICIYDNYYKTVRVGEIYTMIKYLSASNIIVSAQGCRKACAAKDFIPVSPLAIALYSK